MQPNWNQAATELKGKVKFAKVDASVDQKLAKLFKLNRFPSIIYWNYGYRKTMDDFTNYEKYYSEDLQADALVAFGMSLYNAANIIPEVHELYKQSIYEKECKKEKVDLVCVFIFLPDISKTGKDLRNEYIGIHEHIAFLTRDKPVVYFWLQSRDQFSIETVFLESFN